MAAALFLIAEGGHRRPSPRGRGDCAFLSRPSGGLAGGQVVPIDDKEVEDIIALPSERKGCLQGSCRS